MEGMLGGFKIEACSNVLDDFLTDQKGLLRPPLCIVWGHRHLYKNNHLVCELDLQPLCVWSLCLAACV